MACSNVSAASGSSGRGVMRTCADASRATDRYNTTRNNDFTELPREWSDIHSAHSAGGFNQEQWWGITAAATAADSAESEGCRSRTAGG